MNNKEKALSIVEGTPPIHLGRPRPLPVPGEEPVEKIRGPDGVSLDVPKTVKEVDYLIRFYRRKVGPWYHAGVSSDDPELSPERKAFILFMKRLKDLRNKLMY